MNDKQFELIFDEPASGLDLVHMKPVADSDRKPLEIHLKDNGSVLSNYKIAF